MEKCQRCSNVYSSGASFCDHCGLPVMVAFVAPTTFPKPDSLLNQLQVSLKVREEKTTVFQSQNRNVNKESSDLQAAFEEDFETEADEFEDEESAELNIPDELTEEVFEEIVDAEEMPDDLDDQVASNSTSKRCATEDVSYIPLPENRRFNYDPKDAPTIDESSVYQDLEDAPSEEIYIPEIEEESSDEIPVVEQNPEEEKILEEGDLGYPEIAEHVSEDSYVQEGIAESQNFIPVAQNITTSSVEIAQISEVSEVSEEEFLETEDHSEQESSELALVCESNPHEESAIPEETEQEHIDELSEDASDELPEYEIQSDSEQLTEDEQEISEYDVSEEEDEQEISERAAVENEQETPEYEVTEEDDEQESSETQTSDEPDQFSEISVTEENLAESTIQKDQKPKTSEDLNFVSTNRCPEEWEWLVFNDDQEVLQNGYKISGMSEQLDDCDFVLFSDEQVSPGAIVVQIEEELAKKLRDCLTKNKTLEGIRILRKKFSLNFTQAYETIRLFTKEQKLKLPKLTMAIDRLKVKERKEILKRLKNSKTLDAIYLMRQYSRLGLQESREQIEYFCEKEKIEYSPTQKETVRIHKPKKRGGFWLKMIFSLILLGACVWAAKHYLGIDLIAFIKDKLK